jgi:serine/threonine protein kinase
VAAESRETPGKDGRRLGRYELLAELATGGMASVYVARQAGANLAPGMERLVAIKRVHPHLLRLPQFRQMFQDEARVAALIRHANVVRLLDIADEGAELFLVLEYVESVSFAALVREVTRANVTLPPPVTSRIVADVLLGLHAAHETTDARGRPLTIVHRDVSPQNVLVGVDGVSQLIDFGVARASSRATETTGGVVKGKLAYMSPEQAKGGTVDRRSDVFSAGIVMWEALTLKRLFSSEGSDGSNVLLNVLLEPVESPSTVAPGVPKAIDAVVERALERVREERFQTALELHDALVAAIPPASARQVAELLDSLCGAAILQRRKQLHGILESLGEPGQRDSLAGPLPRVSLEPPERAPVATGMAAAYDESRGTKRSRASLWTTLALFLVAGGLSAALYVARTSSRPGAQAARSSPSSAATPEAPADTGTATAPTPPATHETATGTTTSDVPSAAVSAPPSSRHAPKRPRAAPAGSGSAPPSARAPDLHPENPY